MPHNGGVFQTGFNFHQIDGAYAFLNHCKGSQTPGIFGVGTPSPDNLDADNYIINTTGTQEYSLLFFIPTQTERPGQYVVKWDGGGPTTEINIGWLGTVTEGSNIGANGRFKVTLSPAGDPATNGRTLLMYKNVSPNPKLTNLRFVHESDEAALDAGNVFSTKFKNEIVAKGFGVLRDLDWKATNTSHLVKWAHRTRTTSIAYGSAQQIFHDIWAGTANKVGTAYTVSAPPGWTTLQHGRQVIVKWGADGTSGSNFSDTLQVGATAAKPICDFRGDASTVGDARLMRANLYSCLFYDADLDKWLKMGGDNDVGDRFMSGGVPFELFLQLCVEVGAHPWFVQPYLSADAPSDLMSSLASYVDTNKPSWMIPRYELGCNECWNNANAFPGTRYAWNKANARWGVSFDEHNWYGRAIPLNAAAIWSALGVAAKTPSRFKIVCGVQTYGSTSSSNARLASTKHVTDGGTAASNYVDVLAFANYYHTDATQANNTSELALAKQYADAVGQAAKDAVATTYLNTICAQNVASLRTIFSTWITWAKGFGINEFEPYEGGYSGDFRNVDLSSSVTGITRGASTVITTTGVLPYVGCQVTASGIGGTTGLNGNTYNVTAVGSNSFTINVDSSGMGAWTSGGTFNYEGTQEIFNDLMAGARIVDAIKTTTGTMMENLFRLGVRFPSKFMFAGDKYVIGNPSLVGAQIWAGFFPDIYGTNCKEMEFLESFNANPVINFRLNL